MKAHCPLCCPSCPELSQSPACADLGSVVGCLGYASSCTMPSACVVAVASMLCFLYIGQITWPGRLCTEESSFLLVKGKHAVTVHSP